MNRINFLIKFCSKRLFFLAFLFSFCYNAFAQPCQNNYNVTESVTYNGSPVQQLYTCSTYTFTYSITNENPSAVSDQFTINLQNNYLSCTGIVSLSSGVTLSSISPLPSSAPAFNIALPFGQTAYISITVQTQACNTTTAAANTITAAMPNSCFTESQAAFTNWSIGPPNLTVTNVNNNGGAPIYHNVGDIDEYVFEVQNLNGGTDISEVDFTCTPPSLNASTQFMGYYYITSSYTVPTSLYTKYNYAPPVTGQISLNTTSSNQILNNDLPAGNSYFIHVPYTVECTTDPLTVANTTTFFNFYPVCNLGGSSTACGSSPISLSGVVNVAPGNPSVTLSAIDPGSHSGYCDVTASDPLYSPSTTMSFTVSNMYGTNNSNNTPGSARVHGLKLYFQCSNSMGTIDPTSFAINNVALYSVPSYSLVVVPNPGGVNTPITTFYELDFTQMPVLNNNPDPFNSSGSGLQDLNGDGIVDDLGDNGSFTVSLQFTYNTSSSPAFAACGNTYMTFPLLYAKYNDECNSIPNTDTRTADFAKGPDVQGGIGGLVYGTGQHPSTLTLPSDIAALGVSTVDAYICPRFSEYITPDEVAPGSSPVQSPIFDCPNGSYQLTYPLPCGYHLNTESAELFNPGTAQYATYHFLKPMTVSSGAPFCLPNNETVNPTIIETAANGSTPGFITVDFGNMEYNNCYSAIQNFDIPCFNLPIKYGCEPGCPNFAGTSPTPDPMSFELDYLCDPGCTSSVNELACGSSSIYSHGCGSCGNEIGTSSFTFARTNLGFNNIDWSQSSNLPFSYDCNNYPSTGPVGYNPHSYNSAFLANASPSVINLQAGYPGDYIAATLDGNFNSIPNGSDFDAPNEYTDIFVQMTYNNLPANVLDHNVNNQIFDLGSGGTITVTGATGATDPTTGTSINNVQYTIPQSDITYTPGNNSTPFTLFISVYQIPGLGAALANDPNSENLTFVANINFRIKAQQPSNPTASIFAPGNYPLTDLRAQYGYIHNGGAKQLSCDSWGADFTILQPSDNFGPYGGVGAVNITSSCTSFYVGVQLASVGANEAQQTDDFPNEFRPYTSLYGPITLIVPPGYTLAQALFNNSVDNYSNSGSNYFASTGGSTVASVYNATSPLHTSGNYSFWYNSTASPGSGFTQYTFNSASDPLATMPCWPPIDDKYTPGTPVSQAIFSLQPSCDASQYTSTTEMVTVSGSYIEGVQQFDPTYQTGSQGTPIAYRYTVTHVNPTLTLANPGSTTSYTNQQTFTFDLGNPPGGADDPYPWIALENNLANTLDLANATVTVNGKYTVSSTISYTDINGNPAILVNISPDLNANQSVTITVTARTTGNNPNTCQTALNDALVIKYGDQCTGPLASVTDECIINSGNINYTVYPSNVDLGFSGTNGYPTTPIDACKGAEVQYNLVINNPEIGSVTNPVFNINLPSGVNLSTVTPAVSFSYGCTSTPTLTGSALTWNLANVLPSGNNGLFSDGDNICVTVNLTISPGYTPGSAIGFSASGILACGSTVTSTQSNTPPVSSPSVSITSISNIGCSVTKGSATALANGSFEPLTYSWSDPTSQTSATATGLSAGTYTITVTDAGGCTATASAIISQAPTLTASITSSSNVSCNSGNDGSETVTVSGGTSPYTYSWVPGGNTNAVATGLTTGTYTVTVSDADGCTATSSAIISQPSMISVTTSFTAATCGNSNGSASASASGGKPGYVYLWTPSGQTTATATGLSATTYTVKVTDANSCIVTTSVTISQAPTLTASITSSSNVGCNDDNGGSATVTAGGGTSPYTYSWAPGGNTNVMATELTAGTYTITVSDANGCAATSSVTISQPSMISVTTSFTAATCGNSNGSARASASGGKPGYVYLWTPSGQTTATATGLSATTYTVKVTDANSCIVTASVTISQAPTLTASITSSSNVSCNGGNDGSETVTAGGGTSPYTYSWVPGNNTNATATGLIASTYTVTVSDAGGCTATSSAIITQPSKISVTTSFTAATCGSVNGSASASVSGGKPGYVYLWTPSGQTTATATGLSAATYTVKVTDANSCAATASVMLVSQGGPSVSITNVTNELCNGSSTGSATATASGVAPLKYSWSPSGGTSLKASSLSAGTYTITVTDVNGCKGMASITITQPTLLVATTKVTSYNCVTGRADVQAVIAGGTPPYKYQWHPTSLGTNATVIGLTTGTYTVDVTDANGCQASATYTNGGVLEFTVNPGAILCNGGMTTAKATVTSGNPAYTYSWTTSPVQTTAMATRLTAGTYTVTVYDANGCSKSQHFTITQPIALTTSIKSQTNITCYGESDGAATIKVMGGTPNYTYGWTPSGGSGPTASNLTVGTYTVHVIDADDCTASAIITITQPAAQLNVNITPTEILCYGGTGTATANVSGGTMPYTYSWTSNNPFFHPNTASLTNLAAGSYNVIVRDKNGCFATASVTITQPTQLTATIKSYPAAICNTATVGSATITPSGGTPNYTYSWAPTGGNGSTANNLTAGTYTAKVTDANGCAITAAVTITLPPVFIANITNTQNVKCYGSATGSATVTPTGGTANYTYAWTPSGGNGATASNLGAGTYTITVRDSRGCSATASVTITQPATQLNVNITPVEILCYGGTGTAAANVSGGTMPYTYSWTSTGPPFYHANTAEVTGLAPRTYMITVTDKNNCSVTASVTITQPNQLTASTSHTNVTCYAVNNGKASVTANGGTGPYAYSWAPSGGTNATASGLSVGTYTVSVKDANNCSTTATVTITQPPAMSVHLALTEPCDMPASITAGAVGGTGPYTYSWAPSGGTNATAMGLSSATYTVTVTGANGCSSTASTSVFALESSSFNLTVSNTIAFLGPNDWDPPCSIAKINTFAIASSSPVSAAYSWTLKTGSTTVIGTGTSTGPQAVDGAGSITYSVAVNEAFGGHCPITVTHTVNCVIPRLMNPDSASTSDSIASIYVYPNPASSILNIETKLGNGQTESICLYNSLGQRVRCEEIKKDLTTIPISDLAAGIYYFRILSSGGQVLKSDKVAITH